MGREDSCAYWLSLVAWESRSVRPSVLSRRRSVLKDGGIWICELRGEHCLGEDGGLLSVGRSDTRIALAPEREQRGWMCMKTGRDRATRDVTETLVGYRGSCLASRASLKFGHGTS